MATENIYKEESAFVIIMQRGRVMQMLRLSHRRAFSLYKIQCICICARARTKIRAAGALTHNASPGAELHSRNAKIVQRYYRIKRNFSSLPLIVCLFVYLFILVFIINYCLITARCAHQHHADRAPRYFNPAAHTEGKENYSGWCQETDFVFQLLKENF
jgi:hypothetical protein